MTARTRILTVVGLAVALVAATVAWVALSRERQTERTRAAPTQSAAPLAQVESGPRIVFRNTALGPHYGQVAMVRLDDPDGPRAFTTRTCDRVFATKANLICLASEPGLVTTYSATVFAGTTGAATPIPLTGSPSRARLSADGTRSATTSFVAGDSYAAATFSTRTVITTLAGRQSLDLETFALHDRGRRIAPVDRNYWGVTFAADDDHFYATVAYGGVTHLARGRISTRRVDTVRTDAECPSLSPDGTRVAYKKRGDRARGNWRVVVMDIATGRETPIAESRSVDDQVEWLDDDRIVYGLPGEGSDVAQTNVWVAAADGSGASRILIPNAWSPAVVQ